MAEKALAKTGGCLCGAVRYQTSGDAKNVIACHCRSCRRHTGAPVATLAVYTVDQVTFSGDERGLYASSPDVGRGFCAKCGTPLTWETRLGDLGLICAIHVSTFDDPDSLAPSAHSFYGERISWFDVADSLPRYQSFVKDGVLLCHGPASAEPSG